ncbi:MAG TPA: ATP-binding protein [Gemmatimonadaceae bacterium]|nr:ATP-binding protein [Gemmatimonadaceae bacterium]
MTFQRKLRLGFSLMVLPALLVGAEAIRSNILQRRALNALGASLSRTRTYAELETAMFNQSEIVWRYLSGMDSTARREFDLTGQVIAYWQRRWRGELHPDETALAGQVDALQRQIDSVSRRVFVLYDSGHREQAYTLAQQDLRDRLLPQLTALNRYIYRQAREASVRGAYTRLGENLAFERKVLLAVVLLALLAGLGASWRIAEGLARPIRELAGAMRVVGAGDLDHPIDVRARDEIGDLARAFAAMTANLRDAHARQTTLNAELAAKIEQLERTQSQLVQSEKLASIGQTAAAVAHGLRNPLASLRAAAQLALHRADPAASREQLAAIIAEVDRLDRRISHLLSFSRPAPFHPIPESMTALVDGLLHASTQLLAERDIALETALAPDLPEVRVDPMQMEQALLEVIANAVDATPPGGRLRIATRAAPTDDGCAGVVVEIADTGGGIPADIVASVCEPFFTTRPEGTGLGLAIAKRYVEQNGGQLAIASTPGVGTTVRVWLPAAAPAPALAAPAPAPIRERAAS